MKRVLLSMFLAMALLAGALSGCATTPEPTEEAPVATEAVIATEEVVATEEVAAPEELYVVYITPSTESGYWGQYIKVGVENGLLDAETDFGVDVKYEYTGPALEASQDEYLAIMEGVIAKAPDAIVLGQLYPDSVGPLIKQATEAGIYVNLMSVGLDLPGDQYGTLYYGEQSDLGVLGAQTFYDAMQTKGLPMDGVVGIHMSVVVPFLEPRMTKFVETLHGLAPDLTLLDTQYNENDVNNAISLMEAQLATYGDKLVGFYGGNNVTGDAIVRVIQESGGADTLVGVAVDSDPAEIEGMRAGYMDGLVVQTPYAQAHSAAYGAVRYLVTGEEDPDTMNMPASVVTPDAMDTPEAAALLDPMLQARDEQP